MKRAVSVSLGSPSRDKAVSVDFKGVPVRVERIGTGGDERKARRLFSELDGQVDALSVGGIDLYVRLDGRDYPIRSALKLVSGVHQTPLVDGRILKYVLERRIFERIGQALGEKPHFRRAFVPFGTDRVGLIEAVESVAEEVLIGDLMFIFGLPIAVKGLKRFKRLAHMLLPAVGYMPLSSLFPPGAKEEVHKPKFDDCWRQAELIAGDMHYIYKYAPADLSGKIIITNTTTDENLETLRRRGVRTVVTTTPRYDGRSFGVNMMEGALTAYAGKNRPLLAEELDLLIDELDLRPFIQHLNP